jgi:chaperone required for assembly of F1-ATPase
MTEDKQSAIKDSWTRTFPKRFYKSVTVDHIGPGYTVSLDGRTVKTPKKAQLDLPKQAIAAAVAAEFDAQANEIVPGTMPMTRLVNSALDTVDAAGEKLLDEVASYAASDLLCYRAESPAGLVQRQAEHWDPLIDWARSALAADLAVTTGILHVPQPEASVAAIRTAAEDFDCFAMAAMHTLMTMSGSAVVGLAVARRFIDGDAAWRAAWVDEDWQSDYWGRDEEAEGRRARRKSDFDAACRLLDLLQD